MNNLEIQFNAVVIKQLKALNIMADQLGSVLFILFALYEDRIDLLDEFDDFNGQKRAIILYKEMEMRGLVKQNKDEDAPHFLLTDEGIKAVEFIKSEFSKSSQTVTSEDIAIAGVDSLKDELNVDKWINEWIEIFPRGAKSGGRLVRSDAASCLRKMKVFLREYDYDKDTIMRATRAYVHSREIEGFTYMKCAVYFIYKAESSRVDKVSDLATWCEQVKYEQETGQAENSENNSEIMV